MQVVDDLTGLYSLLPAGRLLIPTMGALHQGHCSLIEQAAQLRRAGEAVVTTVFVNPTQFAVGEDLKAYPRDIDRDIERAKHAGTDVLFVPDLTTIYPNGPEEASREAAEFPLPEVARTPGLEDAARPHFFGGVCLAVARLLDLIRPNACFFGEKDYQQLLVIRAMVAANTARFGDLTVHGGATIRQHDGLAMSSRNSYLDDATRPRALGLISALRAADGAPNVAAAEEVMRDVLNAHSFAIDYAVLRCSKTLAPLPDDATAGRALIAAVIKTPTKSVRLIDNASVRLRNP